MVRVLFLGLLAATMCGFVSVASAPQTHHRPSHAVPQEAPLEDDPAVRNERSTNLSHVTGTARKIQMYIKSRHLQLLPDGTANGTTDDASVYSKFRPLLLFDTFRDTAYRKSFATNCRFSSDRLMLSKALPPQSSMS